MLLQVRFIANEPALQVTIGHCVQHLTVVLATVASKHDCSWHIDLTVCGWSSQGITPLYSNLCGGGSVTAQLTNADPFTQDSLILRFYGAADVQDVTASSWIGASGAISLAGCLSVQPCLDNES